MSIIVVEKIRRRKLLIDVVILNESVIVIKVKR